MVALSTTKQASMHSSLATVVVDLPDLVAELVHQGRLEEADLRNQVEEVDHQNHLERFVGAIVAMRAFLVSELG
ncbi:hypothetical protein P7248_24345 [Vibrio parahaemolyticus]|nr:hypothetical protein [Vibrio parahaemolyticus]